MAKIGTNKTIGQPKSGTMRVANATSSGFGIIYADEIIGHRRVDTFAELANIPNWALYDQAGGADISTAKGQLWYVSGDSKLYQLTGIGADGGNRVWTEFKGTDSSYSLPVMTTETLGGAKLVSDIQQKIGAETVSAMNGRTYAVQKNSNNQLVVNVPWRDNNDNTTYTFEDGTNGSFLVTPSNGEQQRIDIGTPTNAGHASTADSATNATNALNATNATNAASADKATKDGDGNVIKSTYATKSEISALTSALVYKGTVSKTVSLPTKDVKVGDVYVVAEASTYAGQACENGDMIIAKVGGNTPEWTIVQTNIDGAITTTTALDDNYIILGAGNKTLKPFATPTGDGYLYWSGSDYAWKKPKEFSLDHATDKALGGIKIGYTAPASKNRQYAVQLSDDDKAFVEVPWTDTEYQLPVAAADTFGGIRLNFTTSGKNYPVKLTEDGDAFVYVPWTDTNTTYTAGDGIKISGNTISWADIPYNKLRDAFDNQFGGYLTMVSKSKTVNGVSTLSYTTGGTGGNGTASTIDIVKIYDSADKVVDGLATIAAVRSTASSIISEAADTYATISSVSAISGALNNKVNTADKITTGEIDKLFTNN